MLYLSHMTWVFYTIITVLGLSFGSFINASVCRLANKLSIVKGRSKCTSCGETLGILDLIPVLSYVALKGKCRYCDKHFSYQYLIVEIVFGLLFFFAAYRWFQQGSETLVLVRDLLVICVLGFLFIYDLRYYLLPDKVTIPAIIVFSIIFLWLGGSISQLFFAILIGAGFFALQFALSKGKWVGGGDIRFGALLGAILGWPVLALGLFISYLLGALVSLPLLLAKKKKFGSKVPFGTFLALGGLIALWWGEQILNWYLSYLV